MRKFLMGLIAALIAISISFVGFTPANATGGNSITVESTSYAVTSANAGVTAEARAVINGASQVTWQVPNHGVKVTRAQLRKAPRIKVRATGANSSAVIYRKARHARVVVLKTGSCVRNTGKENRLRVGFVWCLKRNAVLVLGKSRQYRHAYDLRSGKLVKTCLNYIGGKVPMRRKVVQVRYEADVQKDIRLNAAVNVSASVKASMACPTGTLYGEASASASGTASAAIRVTVRNRASAINVAKAQLLTQARAQAQVSAQASAMARIKLECGESTPPPPATPAPDLLAITTVNDVLVNNTRTIDVNGNTAPGHTGVLFCTANTGSIIAGKQQNVNGSFEKQITYRAGDEPGYDQVTCTLTQDDGQKDVISTKRFEIRPAPVDPL